MLALVKTAEGPGLELRDVPDPAVGINDVLVRVHKTVSYTHLTLPTILLV